MTLTKQHFEKLAAIIRAERAENRKYHNNHRVEDVLDNIAENIAGMCVAENKNFDYTRFIQACDYVVFKKD